MTANVFADVIDCVCPGQPHQQALDWCCDSAAI